MPHFVLEYTDNLKPEARIPELLAKVNAVLIAEGDVFPVGGIRSRAIALSEYRIADALRTTPSSMPRSRSAPEGARP